MRDDKGQLPYPFAGLNRSIDYKTADTMPFQFEVAGPWLKVSGVHLGAIAIATSPLFARTISIIISITLMMEILMQGQILSWKLSKQASFKREVAMVD